MAVPESPSTVDFFLPLQPIQSQVVPKETLLLETELGFIYRLRKGFFRLCNEPPYFAAIAKLCVDLGVLFHLRKSYTLQTEDPRASQGHTSVIGA